MTETTAVPKTVFVGNCQAGSIYWLYNHAVVQDPADRAVYFDGRRLDDNARRTIHQAETLVLQVTDMGALDDLGRPGQKRVLFPYVSGSFIWPYADGHTKIAQPPLNEFGMFSPDFGGDGFLNRFVISGSSEAEAIDAYLSLDIVKAARLDQRLDVCLRMQKSRDERTGIETAAYIERNLAREPLFAGRGHIFRGIFLHLTLQVFDRLGVSSRVLGRVDRGLERSPIGSHMVPIHPSVVRHFNLPAKRDDGLYEFNLVLVNFEEYCRKYIQRDCDLDIHRGVRLLGHNDWQAAADCFSRGLAAGPPSPEGWFLYSTALERLGRKEEAFRAAEAAIRVDPTGTKYLLHYALLQLFRGDFAATEAAIDKALTIQPDLHSAYRLKVSLLETQHRDAEALRTLRRLFDVTAVTQDLIDRYDKLSQRLGLPLRPACGHVA